MFHVRFFECEWSPDQSIRGTMQEAQKMGNDGRRGRGADPSDIRMVFTGNWLHSLILVH